MRNFDDELRARLGTAASDAPRPEGLPEAVLRRARRRRAATATLTGVLTVTLALGGFVGVRAAMDAAAPVEDLRPAEEPPAPRPSPSPSPFPSPSPEPTEVAVPSPDPTPVNLVCEDTEGGSWNDPGNLLDVAWSRDAGVEGEPETVTFTFEPFVPTTKAPKYFISYADELTDDPAGTPVEVKGSAFVAVTFFATGVDLSGEDVVEIYQGPREIETGGPIVLELEQTGDFEGMGSWGIGLSEKACYTVEAGPDHLTITFVS